MSTDIYRAKRLDNGEWIEGYYVKAKDYLTEKDVHVIFPLDTTLFPHGEVAGYEPIIPETVCRLIKTPCYNGDLVEQRFFENDIIAVWCPRQKYSENTPPDSIALVVNEFYITEGGLGRSFPQDTTSVRVIGNAYDNPEFLTGHDINHFINGMHEYPGDFYKYTKEHKYLMDKYKLHGAHACCYMCNFENDYICHTYNGGCDRIDVCRKIREEEGGGAE